MAKIYATLNPADKDASITLSGGNLVATSTVNAWRLVRGTISKSSGKWYWEYTLTTGVDFVSGIANISANLGTFIGGDTNGWGYSAGSGNKFYNGAGTTYGAIYTIGDVIGVALDMDNGILTFYKNNVSQGTAFTGLTGSIFAGISLYGTVGVVGTANFGATTMAYTAPAGFNQGLYTGTDDTNAMFFQFFNN